MSALPGQTHPHQRPEGENRTFQGRNVIAVQFGTCMHCKVALTTLLVGTGTARRWINTETFGQRNVEHACTRGR